MQITSGGRAGGRFRPLGKNIPKPANIDITTTGSFGRYSGRVTPNSEGGYSSGGGGGNNQEPPSGYGFGSNSGPNNKKDKPKALFARKPGNTGDDKTSNFVDPRTEARKGKGNGGGSGKKNNNNKKNKMPRKPKNNKQNVSTMRGGYKDNNNNGNGNYGGNNNNNNTTWSYTSPEDSYGSTSWYSVNKGSNQTVEINSPVKSGLIWNRGQNSNSIWSNLFVSCGELFPPFLVNTTGGFNYLGDIAFTDVYYEYLRICQLKINRIITSNFTLSKWYNYIYTLCKALQIYYLYDSIQAYMTDPMNQSPGLKRLYDRISPEGWNNFSRLKLELSKHYIKPEIVKFISFMYQNFTYHQGESGCIVRLSYLDLLSDDLSAPSRFENGGEIISVITALDGADNLEIASYMSRGFEDWRIKDLPASSVKPIYSENFLNFWLNNNHCAINDNDDQTIQFSKVVTSLDTNSPYYLYGDDVDGVILSCNLIIY
jgi:hypothetical protein